MTVRSDKPVICNFTGVYESQKSICSVSDMVMLDFKDLCGCGMYVDQHAEAVLIDKIRPYAPYGLHFTDNGNYHYMTRLFSSFIDFPFDMAVFDHHSDDQEPAFAGLKSCGSWIRDIRNENSFLENIYMIRSADDIKNLGNILDKPSASDDACRRERPLYISVDKDVLSEDVLKTNWDQGNMSLEAFYEIFGQMITDNEIIGIDICGEDEPDRNAAANEFFNRMIIEMTSDLW